MITSNAPNSPLKVALTGTSTGLPEGPQGRTGEQGDKGGPGQVPQGRPVPQVRRRGPAGTEGREGKQGKEGQGRARRQAGQGRQGRPRRQAGQGRQGRPQGKPGKEGKQGPTDRQARARPARTASSASPRPKTNAYARRGGDAHLQFRLRNRTAGPLRGATVSAEALGVSGTATLKVATLQAGDSRNLTLTLPVGDHASLGRHQVKVQM